MQLGYTNERNVQMLIALMKAHNIKKVVVSPGTTNMTFVAGIQYDPWFEVFSCIDERSAAYIACGLAAESGEVVALSCTGATASRNYLSGLTEAFYRKLPILAITATLHTARLGQNFAQAIDRTQIQKDIAKLSITVPTIHDADDEWGYNVLINKALLELNHRGSGPVHINLTTTCSLDFSVQELPSARKIDRIAYNENCPPIQNGKVAVFVGAHKVWTNRLETLVDEFCEKYNAIVICDHTSNYKGNYGALGNIVMNQKHYRSVCKDMDLLIHIGDISGAYMELSPKEVWRVNPDGEIKDTFKKLRYVFEMDEEDFFDKYCKLNTSVNEHSYWVQWQSEESKLRKEITSVPFSNIWLAKNTAPRLPMNCILHFGILNSLRSWNFFPIDKSIYTYSNVGGFGIDGDVSALIGASLSNPDKLCFGFFGDLAFFYDMNSLGNRHIGSNLRIMMINNGKGTEFKNYSHNASLLGDDADFYIAASGHYANKSRNLVKHYSEDLGFEYLTASSKEEYFKQIDKFTSPTIGKKPILFEVFTNSNDESNALYMMEHLISPNKSDNRSLYSIVKKGIKKIVVGSRILRLKKY